MTTMQAGYEWLWAEPGPKMLLEMLKLYGTTEAPGAKDNPVIIAWGREIGHPEYKHDATAFCGLGMGVAARRSGWAFDPNGNALWGRNWAQWGNAAPRGIAMLGDVLVFPRGKGGHVTLYVGEDATHYHCLGANQMDTVNIVRKAKTPILAIRRAPWKIAQPDNVRVIKLKRGGAPVSTTEA